jgi:uncharacterized cupin superfamily protein
LRADGSRSRVRKLDEEIVVILDGDGVVVLDDEELDYWDGEEAPS